MDEMKERLRSGSSWIASSLWQPFVSNIANMSRPVTCVLYTYSCRFPTRYVFVWKPYM